MENAKDLEVSVRFAVLTGKDFKEIKKYSHCIVPDVTIN
jgi:hypothetical protein